MSGEFEKGDAGQGAGAVAGKQLTFRLGPEVFGLPILKVQEIIGMMTVTAVPRVPEYVRGVINLRGKVIPVVELRRKFLMNPVEDTERTCIIVVEVRSGEHKVTMGILVDEVSEVLEISAGQIEPPPSFGSQVDTRFILGMGKVGDQVVMLLDVEGVLSDGNLTQIAQAAESAG
jgi:purine-binding chemotaxis protein CheW